MKPSRNGMLEAVEILRAKASLCTCDFLPSGGMEPDDKCPLHGQPARKGMTRNDYAKRIGLRELAFREAYALGWKACRKAMGRARDKAAKDGCDGWNQLQIAMVRGKRISYPAGLDK